MRSGMPFTRVALFTSPCSPRYARPPTEPVALRERQRVPVQDPGDRHGDDGDPRHHHHVQDALGPGHPAVEEGQARRHEQDQRRRAASIHAVEPVSIFTQLSLPVCLTGSAARISWNALTDFVSVKTRSRMFHRCFAARRTRPSTLLPGRTCNRVGDACLKVSARARS
jgi:hypothetical protein